MKITRKVNFTPLTITANTDNIVSAGAHGICFDNTGDIDVKVFVRGDTSGNFYFIAAKTSMSLDSDEAETILDDAYDVEFQPGTGIQRMTVIRSYKSKI